MDRLSSALLSHAKLLKEEFGRVGIGFEEHGAKVGHFGTRAIYILKLERPLSKVDAEWVLAKANQALKFAGSAQAEMGKANFILPKRAEGQLAHFVEPMYGGDEKVSHLILHAFL